MEKVSIDLAKLRYNARWTRRFCANRGLELIGVVKGCHGHPAVIDVFQESGIETLGLSRTSVAKAAAPRLRNKPALISFHGTSEACVIPRHFKTSFNSELSSIRALAAAADFSGYDHEIILMVEVGDLREGVMPEDVLGVVRQILEIKSKRLHFGGLGANLGCCSGTLPDSRNLMLLQELAIDIETRLGQEVRTVSVGGTILMDWLEKNKAPSKINQIRIGEAILMGANQTADKSIDYLYSDVFTLKGEILELKEKPSKPAGSQGLDAFGRVPVFKDRGIRKRAIVNFGVLDTDPSAVIPRDKNIEIINSNSEYTIIDVTGCEPPLRKGDILEFDMGYGAMARAFISPYVDIRVLDTEGREDLASPPGEVENGRKFDLLAWEKGRREGSRTNSAHVHSHADIQPDPGLVYVPKVARHGGSHG